MPKIQLSPNQSAPGRQLAPHVKTAVAAVQPKVAGVAQPVAHHVHPVAATVQPKEQKAAGTVRPVAPHVQAAVVAVQPKVTSTARLGAPHVQAKVESVQMSRPGTAAASRKAPTYFHASAITAQTKPAATIQCTKVTLYHGTTAANARGILKTGLLTTYGGNGKGLSNTKETKDDSKNRIFFMNSLESARKMSKFGNVEVIIAAELDDRQYKITNNDGSMGGLYITQDVPPELVSVVHGEDLIKTRDCCVIF